MATSTDHGRFSPGPAGLGEDWRRRMQAAQQDALRRGRTIVSCPAPSGVGGLGRHLVELELALRRMGAEARVIDETDPPDISASGARARLLAGLAPTLRLSPQMRMWAASVRFDLAAAGALGSAEHLIAFNGTALAQFERAPAAGIGSRALVSANSHFARVVRQHELAHRLYPIERPWSRRLLGRNLREYGLADRIVVSSRYVWESFLEEGVSEERLRLFPLTPDPRYAPPAATAPGASAGGSTFDVVFVGSLVVHKGVPLLLEAFARLGHADMRLVLVGGWKTPGMRRHVERARAADPRIVVAPGDPLAHLRGAGVCAHPAFEDGFGYAPAEALASGVPAIVSEDTGMKDLIEDGRTGRVIATGDVDALAEALESAYRGEMLRG